MSTWLCLVLVAAFQQQPPRYVERVDVSRVLIDARAFDRAGRPIRDLTPAHFEVKVDGARARVDSVQWVGTAPPTGSAPRDDPPAAAPDAPIEPSGRLIVLLFQKDLEISRIVGLMRMLIQWQPFLDGLTSQDRIAVLSYDSHLKIWTDFTGDLPRVKQLLKHGILFEKPPPVVESDGPSLLAGLGVETARKTYSIERALIRIAEALKPLPGAKSLVLIGHGFGRLGRDGVMMEGEYEDARDALVAARATVFSLDVTQAHYHSLEAGLRLVSDDTGGFYASTFEFWDQALEQLSNALDGHYVLFAETPRLTPGHHRLSVELKGRKGEVLATREIVISYPQER